MSDWKPETCHICNGAGCDYCEFIGWEPLLRSYRHDISAVKVEANKRIKYLLKKTARLREVLKLLCESLPDETGKRSIVSYDLIKRGRVVLDEEAKL